MDDVQEKACVFGGLIVVVYTVHQLTAGADGVILAAVVAAIAAIGGYTIAVAKLKKE